MCGNNSCIHTHNLHRERVYCCVETHNCTVRTVRTVKKNQILVAERVTECGLCDF